MKTRIIQALIIVLLLILGGWGLDWLFTHVPGYVLIAVDKTSLELNLWFALLALLAAFLLIRYTIKLTRWLLRLLLPLMGFRSPENYTKLTARGLLAYLRGEHDKAQKFLLRSAKKSPMPLVNLLAAADSAHALGNTAKALTFLEKAKVDFDEQATTLALARAEIFRRAGDHEQRLAVLQAARAEFPKDILIQDRLCDTFADLQQWQELRTLLGKIRKRIPKERWQELQARLIVAQFDQILTSASQDGVEAANRKLQILWAEQSSSVHHREEVLLAYAKALVSLGEIGEAETVLRKSLRQHWQRQVVLAYGLLPGEDFQPRLTAAEHWLQKHPHDSALLLTLGRLCLRQQVWGKAQEYFEASVNAGASREAYGELARLLSHLGKHSLSQQAYQQALELDAANLPELPQPKPRQAR